MRIRKKISEISWLYLQQFSSSAFPFFATILITKKFGLEVLGSFGILQAPVFIALPFVMYSFDKEYFHKAVIANSDNNFAKKMRKISDLYYGCLQFRLIASSLSTFLIFIYNFLFTKDLYICFVGLILSLELFTFSFQQLWFANSLKKNELLAFTNLFGRTISLIMLAQLNKSNLNLLMFIAICYAVPAFILSLINHYSSIKIYKLENNYTRIPYNNFYYDLKYGVTIFMLNLQVYLYKDSAPIIMRIISLPDISVGLYLFVERIYQSIHTLLRPLRTFLSRVLIRSYTKFEKSYHKSLSYKYSLVTFFVTSIISIVGFYLIPNLVFSFFEISDKRLFLELLGIFLICLPLATFNGFWSGPASTYNKLQNKLFFSNFLATFIYFGLIFLIPNKVIDIVILTIIYLLTEFVFSILVLKIISKNNNYI